MKRRNLRAGWMSWWMSWGQRLPSWQWCVARWPKDHMHRAEWRDVDLSWQMWASPLLHESLLGYEKMKISSAVCWKPWFFPFLSLLSVPAARSLLFYPWKHTALQILLGHTQSREWFHLRWALVKLLCIWTFITIIAVFYEYHSLKML